MARHTIKTVLELKALIASVTTQAKAANTRVRISDPNEEKKAKRVQEKTENGR
jgi:hypothetical protein